MEKASLKPIDFIKIAIRDYKKVGAITISSKHTIDMVLKALKPEYKYIVEYGAGNGVMIKEILKKLPKDGKIIGIELNKSLFRELKKIKDPRFMPLNGDVAALINDLETLGLPRIDAIVSSIPLSFLKNDQRKKLIVETAKAITKGGRFIVYQYSLLVVPIMKKAFKKVSYSLELRNIPPYFVMVGEK